MFLKPMTISALMKENKVYLGLGSNLGNREKNLENAITEIAKFATISKRSSIIETEPVGYRDQGMFLNMALEIFTPLSPLELIFRLQEIEHKMGRVREIKDGPRTIDLDILIYNQEVLRQKNLEIPHPRMSERMFVLSPLNEIAPELKHPTLNQTIKQLYESKKY